MAASAQKPDWRRPRLVSSAEANGLAWRWPVLLMAMVGGLLSVSMLLPLTAAAGEWSTPQTVATVQKAPDDSFVSWAYAPSIAADMWGSWHLVYGSGVIKYIWGKNGATAALPDPGAGNGGAAAPETVIDPRGTIHVDYRWYSDAPGYVQLSTASKADDPSSWSPPQEVPEHSHGYWGDPYAVWRDQWLIDRSGIEHDVWVSSDASGDWHYIKYASVYRTEFRTGIPGSGETTITILDRLYSPTGDAWFYAPVLAVSNGSVSVAYNKFTSPVEGGAGARFDVMVAKMAAPTRLAVTIPGINDTGTVMVRRARGMFRSSTGAVCSIREKKHESSAAIRQRVRSATRAAVEANRDVIVNIDMDLEKYSILREYRKKRGRWQRSVEWAGRVANEVSRVFSEECPAGERVIYAHSAGGDAASESIRQKLGTRMYDSINIFNGRTSAKSLSGRLRLSQYEWWQVKVFTNTGDLWSLPKVPLVPESGSLSNYNAAGKYAGESWVRFWGYSSAYRGHGGLVNCVGKRVPLKVYTGRQLGYQYNEAKRTVEEMMSTDWRFVWAMDAASSQSIRSSASARVIASQLGRARRRHLEVRGGEHSAHIVPR